MKKKYVFVGDLNSINLELICKSHNFLKHKVKYLLLGNLRDIKKYLERISSNIKINLCLDPINFTSYKRDYLNIFNIENISKKKYINMLNQIKISNFLSTKTKNDLVTMPINKYLFKKNIAFNGMTEHLGKLNNKNTIMLLHGENFSVIPLTTHINPKNIYKFINQKNLTNKIMNINSCISDRKYKLKISGVYFLCYNPHCGENGTLGSEDIIITNTLKQFKKIKGPYSSDGIFKNYKKNSLFLSTYHDQVLIPFKILNRKGINITLGLDYRRLSPAHGTASDKIYKNISNNISYIECMKI